MAVGLGIPYTPGATADELAAVTSLAGRHDAFVLAHLSGGVNALKTAIGVTSKAGAPLHIAHVNSTAGEDVRAWLDLIRAARAQGADVTTEVYPYTAGATLIQSALYDGWEKWPEESFATLQWAATGSA